MGVDCRITLPPATRVMDVATVIGALAGLPLRHECPPDCKFGWAKVDGIKASSCSASSLPECCNIEWTDLDGEHRHVIYHFEWDYIPGYRGMLPRSTPFWVAVARKLVDFFGGEVDYRDCDVSDCDYKKPAKSDIHASDGKPWERLQKRLLAVKPLTRADIETARPLSAYSERDWKPPEEIKEKTAV